MARSEHRAWMNDLFPRRLIFQKSEGGFWGAPIIGMEIMSDTHYKEFICDTCHCHVFTWSDDNRTKCAVCYWIATLDDITPEQEAEIRVMTATPILNKYRDDSYQERKCDCCGKLYRGPAVYCSFECAIKDA